MSRYSSTIVTKATLRPLLTGALTAVLASPLPATAFFQSTKLEGTIGSDIGGVWLSVQQVMPEFRINYPKPAGGRAVPIVAAPIPAELEAITGKNVSGIVIEKCQDARFCADQGLLVGDMVIQINNAAITDVASFEKAIETLPATVLLTVRRPALKLTTARLVKIKYASAGKETSEGSVAQEELRVNVLDVALPFAEKLEETRKSHTLYQPTEAEIEALGKSWVELPSNRPQMIMNASHRFVTKAMFDEALTGDINLVKSKYVLMMQLEDNPTRGGGGKAIDLYGIESLDPKSMDGTYVSVTMASAPFPINIEFKGRFHMTRIADWTDQDDKLRAEREKKPAEDLNKYKVLPDVPPEAKEKK